MTKVLLLACSAQKSKTLRSGPADQIYTGALFRKGMQYARTHGYSVHILSAKYGWIRPWTVIKTYDQKRDAKAQPPATWPRGTGYYLGGKAYFASAPERFTRLVPFSRVGYMLGYMDMLMAGTRPENLPPCPAWGKPTWGKRA